MRLAVWHNSIEDSTGPLRLDDYFYLVGGRRAALMSSMIGRASVHLRVHDGMQAALSSWARG